MVQYCTEFSLCTGIKLCHCKNIIVHYFFSETELSHDRLIYIDKEKACHEAQDYCREHHTDLASEVG